MHILRVAFLSSETLFEPSSTTKVDRDCIFFRIQAEGIGVWIWPNSDDQENEAFYRSLFELGIDGVIAGVPAEGVAAALG